MKTILKGTKKLGRLSEWYYFNLGKIVFLLLTIVFFTLTILFIPFLNILITPEITTGISIVVWYMLFLPRTKVLFYICCISLVIGLFYTVVGISSFIDSIGVVLFLLIIFILINYIREEIT